MFKVIFYFALVLLSLNSLANSTEKPVIDEVWSVSKDNLTILGELTVSEEHHKAYYVNNNKLEIYQITTNSPLNLVKKIPLLSGNEAITFDKVYLLNGFLIVIDIDDSPKPLYKSFSINNDGSVNEVGEYQLTEFSYSAFTLSSQFLVNTQSQTVKFYQVDDISGELNINYEYNLTQEQLIDPQVATKIVHPIKTMWVEYNLEKLILFSFDPDKNKLLIKPIPLLLDYNENQGVFGALLSIDKSFVYLRTRANDVFVNLDSSEITNRPRHSFASVIINPWQEYMISHDRLEGSLTGEVLIPNWQTLEMVSSNITINGKTFTTPTEDYQGIGYRLSFLTNRLILGEPDGLFHQSFNLIFEDNILSYIGNVTSSYNAPLPSNETNNNQIDLFNNKFFSHFSNDIYAKKREVNLWAVTKDSAEHIVSASLIDDRYPAGEYATLIYADNKGALLDIQKNQGAYNDLVYFKLNQGQFSVSDSFTLDPIEFDPNYNLSPQRVVINHSDVSHSIYSNFNPGVTEFVCTNTSELNCKTNEVLNLQQRFNDLGLDIITRLMLINDDYLLVYEDYIGSVLKDLPLNAYILKYDKNTQKSNLITTIPLKTLFGDDLKSKSFYRANYSPETLLFSFNESNNGNGLTFSFTEQSWELVAEYYGQALVETKHNGVAFPTNGMNFMIFDKETNLFFSTNETIIGRQTLFPIIDNRWLSYAESEYKTTLKIFNFESTDLVAYKHRSPLKETFTATQDQLLQINLSSYLVNADSFDFLKFNQLPQGMSWQAPYINILLENEDFYQSSDWQDDYQTYGIQKEIYTTETSSITGTFSIEVNYINTNDAPIIYEELTLQKFVMGDVIEGDLKEIVRDPDREKVFFSYRNLPDGITGTEGGILSGSASKAGKYIIEITARDDEGSFLTFSLELIYEEDGIEDTTNSSGGAVELYLTILSLFLLLYRRENRQKSQLF